MSSESRFQQCPSCKKIISKNSRECPNCGVKVKKITPLQWVGIVIFAFLIIGLFNSPDTKNTNITTSEVHVSEKTQKKLVSEQLKLDYEWRKIGFGSVLEADFTITNNSEYDIKDVDIQCEHYSKSDTKIDSNNEVIYEVFNSKTTKKINNFNMGFIHSQVNSSSCHIKSFVII